jgi:outer membrane protein insertion porin family
MNKFFRYALLVLLLGAGTLCGQSPSQVRKIELKQVGSQAVSEPLIRANIRVKEGDQFSRLAVDDDVRNLYGTGYFYNIRILENPTPEGYVLTYVLVTKPRITDIKFNGNTKWDADDLQKVVKSKVGDPLDERKLFADAQEIKKKYVNAGYNRTDVEYKFVNFDENAGRAGVVFEVKETPKIRIVDVVFEGANAFSQKKLRREVKTRRWWIFSWITQSGKLKDDVLEDDQDKLADFYRNQGYIDFQLKDVRQEFLTPTRVKLHFVINEGRQYRVGAIGFKGVTVYSTNDLSKVLKMNVGETFTPKALSEDRQALEDFYGAKGYVDAAVFARKNPNIETGTMDLLYEFREGEQFRIGRIDIKGNVKTKDKVIRRELAVSPGETFDMVRVKRSKSRLQQMGFFERVDTRAEEADARDEKNLVVGVEERNTGNFTIGAGFSSVDSLVGFIEIYQGNFDLFKPPTFTGAGQKFRLRASVGTVRQDYQISFIEPWFLDQKLALGADLYYRELGFYSDLFDERRGGGKLSLTRALGSDFLIGSVSYTAESVGIVRVNPNSPATIIDAEGDHLLNRFGASIAYDTRNNALLPDRGQRSELVAEAVVGDANLYKMEAKTAWFFPGFFEGHVLELGLKAGVVEAFDSFGTERPERETYYVVDPITQVRVPKTRRNLPHNDVPFFERYFLGGAYSLRGFRYRDVGPQERGIRGEGFEPVGGNTYYLGYAEYSVPIIAPVNPANPNEVSLRLAAFYDMGNVYYKSYEFDPADYSSDVGMGIRLNIPRLGPLRFDYGIPLKDSTGNAGGGRFNFTVGYQREF